MRPLYRAGQRDTCTVRSQPVYKIWGKELVYAWIFGLLDFMSEQDDVVLGGYLYSTGPRRKKRDQKTGPNFVGPGKCFRLQIIYWFFGMYIIYGVTFKMHN